MAWYGGTDDYSLEELEKEYPVAVTSNLRTSEDRKRLAIINDYPEGTELYELSDPKVEKDHWGKHVFYQTFLGADAFAAKTAVEAFLSRAEEDGESILLLRKDPDRLFTYSHGHICSKLTDRQAELRALLKDIPCGDPDVFMLPLKRYLHRCPVCGHRTLRYRNQYEICIECGWEDEPGMEDYIYDPSSANHGLSMVAYRERYLQKKAEDPDYSWAGAVGTLEEPEANAKKINAVAPFRGCRVFKMAEL